LVLYIFLGLSLHLLKRIREIPPAKVIFMSYVVEISMGTKSGVIENFTMTNCYRESNFTWQMRGKESPISPFPTLMAILVE
jgi:hypothetical protein